MLLLLSFKQFGNNLSLGNNLFFEALINDFYEDIVKKQVFLGVYLHSFKISQRIFWHIKIVVIFPTKLLLSNFSNKNLSEYYRNIKEEEIKSNQCTIFTPTRALSYFFFLPKYQYYEKFVNQPKKGSFFKSL